MNSQMVSPAQTQVNMIGNQTRYVRSYRSGALRSVAPSICRSVALSEYSYIVSNTSPTPKTVDEFVRNFNGNDQSLIGELGAPSLFTP